MIERVPVHPSTSPAPSAQDGGDQVRADASFDLHVPWIPRCLADAFEAFVFGFFAFGFRASLFDRICPLAMVRASVRWDARFLLRIGGGPGVETRLKPIEQIGPQDPR